ncbi:unnamed protein product [Amoebophrya sp. A25]|nr:unnamed protein product [Amoebophrya sp. A25]|eukprot:GSA25T00017805001.1
MPEASASAVMAPPPKGRGSNSKQEKLLSAGSGIFAGTSSPLSDCLLPLNSGESLAPICYALRCACRDPSLELERAFECEVTPSLVRDFGRKAISDSGNPVKIVQGYILGSEFRGNLERVAKNGFKPRDAVKIHVGNIAQLVKGDIMNTPVDVSKEEEQEETAQSEADEKGDESSPNKRKSTRNAAEYLPRALMRCKLCVRKPFVTYDESYFLCNQIPDEYDSMVLLQKNAEGQEGAFRATYVIRDAAQMVPEFYLEFNVTPKSFGETDDTDADDKPVQWCTGCKEGEKQPAIFCIEEDGWMFCQKCLDELFEKLPMMKEQRTVVALADMKPTFAHCAVHGDRKAEWWCVDCKKALCVACKVSGSHSKGRAATHRLMHIREKYEEVKDAMSVCPQEVQDARCLLHDQMDMIEKRSQQVEDNISQLLQDAQKKAEELERQIRVLGAKKLDSLRSRKHLAERNLKQIDWASNFADYITDHTVMPAEVFLQSAPFHEKLIESLVENVVSVDEEQYLEKADLQLEGHLSVIIETQEKSQSPVRARGGLMSRFGAAAKKPNRTIAAPALAASAASPESSVEEPRRPSGGAETSFVPKSVAKKLSSVSLKGMKPGVFGPGDEIDMGVPN